MTKNLTTTNGFLQTGDSEYVRLVSLISGVWDKAREKAALSVNTELLDANRETGRYIVRFPKIQTVSGQLTWNQPVVCIPLSAVSAKSRGTTGTTGPTVGAVGKP